MLQYLYLYPCTSLLIYDVNILQILVIIDRFWSQHSIQIVRQPWQL